MIPDYFILICSLRMICILENMSMDKVNSKLRLRLTVIQPMSETTMVTNRRKSTNKKEEQEQEEELYIDTVEAEHIEMYLKAIWAIRERKEEIKVSSIAKLLNIRQPSVVQMLRKLNDANLVEYKGGKNIVNK